MIPSNANSLSKQNKNNNCTQKRFLL